ncbi:3-keto-5-aminohexanoate cleavage protein [uncultured Shimia sp.]|uniref:3-keto-5-aminohexanoate cleavage protein n=1 Tax=uncultured Shimia sp. TaxID=573152 RepID=UPI00262EFC78|nr:3-keto-5-aminohexanoate cleavage protein [uncultured Shimia sp.]
MQKTIVTCAITGAIHTPTMSDALPHTPERIAEQAIEAAHAGATILHLHGRNPDNGMPSINPEHFTEMLKRIKAETDAIVNISTGGSITMSIEDRLAPATAFSPEMCSMNMGSLNFSIHPLANRYETWKYDWEEPYIRATESGIFRNTFADIKLVADQMGGDPHNAKFEHECYDVGHLHNLAFCLKQGMFKAPIFLQFVMGILGGIPAELEHMKYMKETADRLFGDTYQWSVIGAGAAQLKMAAAAAQMGGHVRVGLEDSLFIDRGVLAKSNAQQVEKVVGILRDQGNEVATPDEARKILGLKGGDNVAF